MQRLVHNGRVSSRELRHANISYYYKSLSYNQDIMLKSKSSVGEKIQLSVDPNNPEKVEQYYPTKELLAAMMIQVTGLTLVTSSIILMNKYG